MPLIVANAIRTLIIFLIQSGFIAAASAMLDPLITSAKNAVKNAFGLSDDDAMTYVANFTLDVVELAGLSIVAFKSRLPLKIADRLGFTNKGFARRGLPAKVSTGNNAPGSIARAAGSAAKVPTRAEAISLINIVKSGATGIKNVMGFLEKRLNTVFLGFLVAGGWLDFANWETGAYSQQAQKVFETVSFGLIKPDEDFRKTKTASPEVFDKIYNSYKLQGAGAISDPFKKQSVIFTRDNLIDLIDQLGARSLTATGSASTKEMLAAATPLIRFSFPVSSGGATPPVVTTTTGGVASAPKATTIATPVVFTGVVSQGSLGDGSNFVPRPDDLITDINDMKEAAANNIAPFLAALPSRVVYEIKVVASYVDKSGFTHRGTTQRIQSGTYSNGTPKYKTVTNKFAVANLYVVTAKGTRTKIDTIVLGPTDASRFQPTTTDVDDLAASLRNNLTSSYSSANKSQSSKSSSKKNSDEPKPGTSGDKPSSSEYKLLDDGQYEVNAVIEVKGKTVNTSMTKPTFREAIVELLKENNWKLISAAGIDRDKLAAGNYTDPTLPEPVAKQPETEPASGRKIEPPKQDEQEVIAEVPKDKPAVCSAGTLFDFYGLKGSTLPSVEERQPLYERLGLGQASYYTGTAEQNAKLLSALKAESGC